jgi:hypothetical protein
MQINWQIDTASTKEADTMSRKHPAVPMIALAALSEPPNGVYVLR